MTYLEALSSLGETRRFGMKPGLEPMRGLAWALGEPQKNLRFIHLAGTNGKGSSAAFCESCLRASGYRVGLYTSPHLVSVRERIQINRVLISEADFTEGFEALQWAALQTDHLEATFFELMTALALWYFAREKVDWVVWETGLGGRLDATNIVEPKVCIITNVGLDHQQYLGQSLREIATEKAGIIKRGVPVVSAVENGDAAQAIIKRAENLGCDLTLIHGNPAVKDLGMRDGRQRARMGNHEFYLGLIGSHQVYNAACAVEALRKIGLKDEAIFEGLKNTLWPGRFEVLSEKPFIVLDGAHNAAGMKSLVETWRSFLQSKFGWTDAQAKSRAHLVFACAADKDITEMAQLLAPFARQVSLVRLANERGAEPSLLAQSFPGLPCRCYESAKDTWTELATAGPEEVILITGSLFLVGEILARRQGNSEEYRLNERLEKVEAAR